MGWGCTICGVGEANGLKDLDTVDCPICVARAERDKWKADYQRMQREVVDSLGLEEDHFTSTCLESYAEEKWKAEAERDRLREALSFYADPDTYFAIGFFPDRPCGELMDDFGTAVDEHGFERTVPGKRARALLNETKGGE